MIQTNKEVMSDKLNYKTRPPISILSYRRFNVHFSSDAVALDLH